MANTFFPELYWIFSQFVNQNVKILGRRLYSPSLKDVAVLEVTELFFFYFPYICLYIFSREPCLDVCLPCQIYRQMYGKIRKIIWASSSRATSFKPGECNLLPRILTLHFSNCVKFNFGRINMLSDSHTNTVISDRFVYPSRWRRKPW